MKNEKEKGISWSYDGGERQIIEIEITNQIKSIRK